MKKNQKSGGVLLPEQVKTYRQVLKITQIQAAELCGGGPNAFSRYEGGKTKPSRATCNLLKLLAKYPHELDHLLTSDKEESV